ncbi:SIMPL domain-containing protein [Arcticibacter sp.]|uniref:SIMPL domain-containing protein n=1 Tax=Arcticibacter sp. TaxID=1872630 RepID=UPI00388F5ABC
MRTYITASVIAVALLIGSFVLAGAYKYKYKDKKRIIVTGLAEKNFVSDLIVWNCNYSKKSMDLREAYAALKKDENAIKRYLTDKGLKENEMIFSSVTINKEFEYSYTNMGQISSTTFAGYNLIQTVKIESKNINIVEKVSREITGLIEMGIELNSNAPEYYYSRLSELKIDLLSKASKDAKDRAGSIAENAGSNLGELKYANMGVFQITGQNSNENYSYGGTFNTASKNKTASITLRTEYAID